MGSQETVLESREGWQIKSRGPNSRRTVGGRGKEESRYTSSPGQQHEESGSRSERPPWSDPNLVDGQNESRRMGNTRGQPSNNDQMGSWSERKTDGNEAGNSKGGQSDGNTKKP